MGYPPILPSLGKVPLCGCKSRRSDLPNLTNPPSQSRRCNSGRATLAGRINRHLPTREMCTEKRKPYNSQFRLCLPDAKTHPKGGEYLQYPIISGDAGANSGKTGNGLRRPNPPGRGHPSPARCPNPDRAAKARTAPYQANTAAVPPSPPLHRGKPTMFPAGCRRREKEVNHVCFRDSKALYGQ